MTTRQLLSLTSLTLLSVVFLSVVVEGWISPSSYCHHSGRGNLLSSSSNSRRQATSLSESSSEVTPSPSSSDVVDENAAETADVEEMKLKTKQLCNERNLNFEKVKNARDLATVSNSPVQPGRLYRTGRLSDATIQDVELFMKELNVQTLVDLRSPTELKEDTTLLREEVFGNYTSILWQGRGRGKVGCIKQIKNDEMPIPKRRNRVTRFWKRNNPTTTTTIDSSSDSSSTKINAHNIYDVVQKSNTADGICDEEGSVCATNGIDVYGIRKERHFCSLVNEFKYVMGTLSKLRKRDITKAALVSPGALISTRVRDKVKKPFLDEINDGGLPMLNDILLKGGAPGIRYVLDLCSDSRRHPIAFYCTAGKDRTGMIAAIILGICGTKSEDIVEDYSLSANVYAEMNDHKAMVGALSQRNLNPKTFLGAPPQVMRDTLENIEKQFGSIDGYCDWIGFDVKSREKLRNACMGDAYSNFTI